MAEYPVEFNSSDAATFQRHIEALRARLADACESGDCHVIHSSFRGEMRDFRDKANDWLANIRSELKSAADAMQALTVKVAENGNGHEERLKTDLHKLTAVIEYEDLSRIRNTVRHVANSIEKSYEQMRDANNLMIAQLRDEIQALHREMDNSRRSLFQDRASGAWNRQKIEFRLEELLERGDAFVVVVVWISNLKRLEASIPTTMINGAMKAMVQRAIAAVGDGTQSAVGPRINSSYC